MLFCFSSISHSCQRSNNTVFVMHCLKPIRGPELQLSKSRSIELYWEQAGSGAVAVWVGLILLQGSVSLLKQSDVEWLAHTYKLTGSVAGMLSLKMKGNHCLFCCSVAGTEYRHLCWFIQPTTEQFACLALRHVIAKHCYLTAGDTDLHLGDGCPKYHQYHQYYLLWKWLLSLRNNRNWIWTACRSPVLQYVGCRDHAGLICFPHYGSWQAQGGLVYICRDQRKRVFHSMGPLNKSHLEDIWIPAPNWDEICNKSSEIHYVYVYFEVPD